MGDRATHEGVEQKPTVADKGKANFSYLLSRIDEL